MASHLPKVIVGAWVGTGLPQQAGGFQSLCTPISIEITIARKLNSLSRDYAWVFKGRCPPRSLLKRNNKCQALVGLGSKVDAELVVNALSAS